MVANVTGKDYNFYKEVTVTRTGSFAGVEDLIINVKGTDNLILHNTGSAEITYSFNGNTIHGKLTAAGGAVPVKTFNNRRVSKIWFYCASGSNVVRVEAW
jgi:hypothetical protein